MASGLRLPLSSATLAYDVVGAGEPAVLALHGYMAGRRDFEGVLPRWGRDRLAMAADLPGHGDASRAEDPAAYGLERLARDVIEALPLLATGPLHLLGHSLGGMIALRVALAAPERLASLTLVATTARPVRPARALAEATPELLKDRALENAARTEPVAARALRDALAQAPSLVARLGSLRLPTLCVVGKNDPQFLALTGELAMLIPGARLEVLAQTGHQPQLERPELFAEVTARFFAAT